VTIKSSADNDAFNEGLSEEEEKLLAEQSAAAAPPPAASEGEDGEPAGQTAAAPAAAEPGKEGEAAPTTDVNAEADAEARESFEQFAAKHKDRSPEELLKLAFQKEQARKSARFDAKEARDVVSQIRDGMQKRLADSQQRRNQEKDRFNQTLAEDPDKAAQMAFEAVQNKEAEEEQAREWQGYVAKQTEITRSIIPNFDTVGPELMSFGVDRIGYEPGQVAAAHDARDIVTLYFASRFDKLVQAGIVDMEGRILNGGQPTAGAAPVTAPNGQSRAPRTPPLTMSSAPGNGGGGSKSLKDQAQDILTMSEADFDKAVESGLFDQTLRSLSGGGR
jgi:hypothetical protein